MRDVPHCFNDIVGHRGAMRLLRRAVASGSVAHAYLFTGQAGVGKFSLAHAFAAALTCLQPTPEGDPCGECESCRRFAQGTHPEVHLIAPYSEQTLIWQLWEGHNTPREAKPHQVGVIGRTIHFAPSFGRRVVYILTRAETLTEPAANSLLKTLEEPPPYAVFLLLAPMLEDVLETIRSRCQWVPLQAVDIGEIAQWLEQRHGVPADMARRCALISQGCPGRAWSLATQPQALKLWDSLADLAYEIATGRHGQAPALLRAEQLRTLASTDITISEDTDAPADTGGKGKTPKRGALLLAMDALGAWFRDALWLSCGGRAESIVYRGDEGRLQEAASRLGIQRLMHALNAILEVRRAVEGNANIPLASEVLLLRLLG